HRRCGNERPQRAGGLARDRALITSEDKQFVLLDGSTNCSSILVALQTVTSVREEITRIEFVIADKLEQRAVPIVGAGFRHCIDGASGMKSVLGWKRTGLHFEFLKSIREWQWQTIVGVDVIVKSAIQRVRVSTEEPACDRKARGVRIHAPRVRIR